MKKELRSKDTVSKSAASIVVPKKRVNQLGVAIGVVFVLLLSFLGYFLFTDEGETTERIPIVVADFVNETDEKELDGLSGLLITSLEQSRKLSVLTRSRMFDILKQLGKEEVTRIDENLSREICKQANINALVMASIRKLGQRYSIDLKVLDPQKDEYLFTAKKKTMAKRTYSR